MGATELEKEVRPQEPTTIWNRTFISLFFTNLAFNLGLTMTNSLIPIYTNSLGEPPSIIGIIASTYTMSSIFMRFVSAPIIDTYNRKYIVIFACVMVSISFWGLSISTTVPALMAFRLLQGCGMAFGNSCCLTMVSTAVPKDKYTSGIAYYSLALTTTQAVGPLVGLTLSAWVGFSMTFVISALAMLAAGAITLLVKIDFKRTKKFKLSLGNTIAKEALLPSFLMFLLVAGGGALNSFLIIFAAQQGVTTNIGLFFTVNAVMMFATRPIIGKLIDRFGTVKVFIPALLCNVISFVIISFSKTLPGFLLAAVIMSFGHGACQPSILALSMKSVPNERRGAASSTNYIGMDLGTMVGPMVAGNVAQVFGYFVMWRSMTLFFVIALVCLILARKMVMKIESDFAAG